MLVVATISFAFSQKSMSSKDVFDEWNEKRIKVEKMNEDPAVKKQLLDQLDSAYVLFFKIALENEQKLPTTTVANNTPANQTTQNTHQQSIGGNFSLPNFQGGSLNVTKAADAYATVTMANANAYLISQMASGGQSTYSAPNNNMGLEGVIINKDSYQEFSVVIIGVDPSNSYYRKSLTIGKGEKTKIYLPVGKYTVTSKGDYEKEESATVTVYPNTVHQIYGENVFFWITTGKRR